MPHTPSIVWFRRDLRVTDHPALRAAAQAGPVLGVFALDASWTGMHPLGFARCGTRRLQFLLQGLHALQGALRALGGELIVVGADAAQHLAQLATQLGADVHVHDEPGTEEAKAVRALQRRLAGTPCRVHVHAQGTLHETADLPFALADMPTVFTHYRKAVEKAARVAVPLAAPPSCETLPDAVRAWTGRSGLGRNAPLGHIPDLAELDRSAPAPETRMDFDPVGGSAAGWARWKAWAWEGDHLCRYRETRNGLVGADYASRLSPWLALGMLSTREVAADVARYEQERGANTSTGWLIFELLWRDFFRWHALAAGENLFRLEGYGQRDRRWTRDVGLFDRWCRGETGVPFVDAAMRELRCSGWQSNRARQNAASFLARGLNIDWRWGAAWFESRLVDYDVASNWGNWQYVAGVGHDPRDRTFHVVGQGERYDPGARFIRRWVPELAERPEVEVHRPWLGDPEVRARSGYPEPIGAERMRS